MFGVQMMDAACLEPGIVTAILGNFDSDTSHKASVSVILSAQKADALEVLTGRRMLLSWLDIYVLALSAVRKLSMLYLCSVAESMAQYLLQSLSFTTSSL